MTTHQRDTAYTAVALDDEPISVTSESAPLRVAVTAPATLPEGFKFDASYNGEILSLTVVCMVVL